MSDTFKEPLFLTGTNLVPEILGPLAGGIPRLDWNWIFHTILPVMSLAYSTWQYIGQAPEKVNVTFGGISVWHLIDD